MTIEFVISLAPMTVGVFYLHENCLKNIVERYMITQTILFHLSFNANHKPLRLVRVLMLQPFHRPDIDSNNRHFIFAAVPLPFTAAGV